MTYTGTFGYAPRTEESLRALVLQRVFSLLGTTTNHLSQPLRCTYFTITRPPSLRPNSLVLVDSSSSPRNVIEATRIGILSKWVRSIQRKSELCQGKTDSVWRYRPWSWWVVVWWEWFSSYKLYPPTARITKHAYTTRKTWCPTMRSTLSHLSGVY